MLTFMFGFLLITIQKIIIITSKSFFRFHCAKRSLVSHTLTTLSLHYFIWPTKNLKQLLMQGFSMVPFYHRDKIALIAFGGNKKEPCNKVKQWTLIKEPIVTLQKEKWSVTSHNLGFWKKNCHSSVWNI